MAELRLSMTQEARTVLSDLLRLIAPAASRVSVNRANVPSADEEIAGFWVENGVIAYPVEEITIAGNLADMFKGIVAIGGDVIQRGGKRTGSILIDRMAVAGA